MLKIIFKSLVIILIFLSTSFAEVIKKLEITGNKRITSQSISVLGGISLNEEYNDSKLNSVLKKLYNTNFFSNINLSIENSIMKIDVVENPIIENIEITGIKNKNLLKSINDQMILKNRMSYTEAQFSRDLNIIKNIFKSSGFYFAKINSSMVKDESLNSINLTINIDKGDRAKIKEIVFIGDKKIKDKKLLEVITSEEHRFWKFISNKVFLNESLIELDKRLLTNYYRNLGYYKVKVLNSFAELKQNNSFKIVYNIDAGEKYFFNDFTLNLPTDYQEKDFSQITKIFSKLKGSNYSLDNLNLILEEIDYIASLRLYDFIDINVTEDISDDKINFTFNVVDSEKFYVERINIIGNFVTIEEAIRNKFIVDEGDPLNNLLFNKSIDEIRSLGIFKSVQSEIKDGSQTNLKIVDIKVEEKPTGEISLGAGVGTNGTTIGGGIKEKNFLGKGINLSTELDISEEALKGKFVYSKPNFAYTDNTLFTSVNSSTSDFLTDYGYKISDIGFSVGTSFEQFENLFFSPELSIAIEDLKTNSTASTNLKKQEGSYEDFYFNYGLDYDLRDSRFRPTKGSKTSFYQQLPIISGNNEIVNVAVFTQYKTLSKKSDLVGKASVYFKAVNSLDDSDVRISKRAQVPSNRLRGFQRGKVGPVDSSDFIGGNYVSTLNLSTNLPGLSSIEALDFNYFIDIANVWGVDYSSNIDESNVVRSSTGIALDVFTPIGPLSFSFAKPITQKNTDKTETFRFNLGTTF